MGGGGRKVMKRVCVRSIEGLEVERGKNIGQERKRKGLDAKNVWCGRMQRTRCGGW